MVEKELTMASTSSSDLSKDSTQGRTNNPSKQEEKCSNNESKDLAGVLTRQTILFSLCAAINSCNLGYDVGVSTHASSLVQNDLGLTDVQREFFVGSLNLWSIFGSLFAHWICDKYGRRHSFVVAAVGFIIGLVIMAAASDYLTLMIGRVFVGLGVGFGLAIDPLYIAEIAPAAHRGRLVTWSEIGTNVGIVLGFFSAIVFYNVPNALEWRMMFVSGCFLPLVMILLVRTVMPESPRYLVAKGREEEAKAVLEKLSPPGFNADPIVQDIKEAIARERLAEKSIGWNMILSPTPAIRRMLFAGLGTAIAQQAVGIDAIQYYLVDVLKDSGIQSEKTQLWVLVLLGFIKLVFIFVGGHLFDKRGRRPLLFASLGGMVVALAITAASFIGNEKGSSVWAICGLALYLSFFSIGMGPGAWLIPSEVFATSIRAKAMSLATFSNRTTAAIMSSSFLSVVNWMGLGAYFIALAAICSITILFLYFFLPETKGHSLEEMTLHFAKVTGDTSILEAEKRVKDLPTLNVEMPKSEPSPQATENEDMA